MPVTLLLHGITASGRCFGADYDHLAGGVIVPDLLGFGRSFDVPSDAYDRAAHLDAVTSTLDAADVLDRPLVVVGHSMGAVLALHLATILPQVLGVVAIAAPLYEDEDEALRHIRRADALARLLAYGDTAQRVCRWMCAHREFAGRLWPLLAPRLPRAVAADGVLHTWPAYHNSLSHLVLDSDYRTALGRLGDRRVPVWLLNGSRDPVPVEGRAAALANTHPSLLDRQVDGADHALPLTNAEECVGMIGAVASGTARS